MTPVARRSPFRASGADLSGAAVGDVKDGLSGDIAAACFYNGPDQVLVQRSVQAAGAAFGCPRNACDGNTIPGSVTITGASAMVTVGELHQHGTLTLEHNAGGIYFVGSQVDGRAYVENNSAPAPVENAVMNNTITGSLYCAGNNPAPADNGIVNTVSGTASGQCAAIAEP